MTFSHALATNNYGPAKFIVDASAANGTHTTIAAALTSASSGDTIFIRQGTYTENITLKAGVNLTSYNGNAETPNVTIIGTCTFTAAGTVSITGIRLQTNSAFALAVTGSSASIVNLFNCYLNCTNNTGISFTSSSSSATINIFYCGGNLGTTGIAWYSMSSTGSLNIEFGSYFNTGASTTASSNSAGIVNLTHLGVLSPFSTSSTGVVNMNYSNINTSTQNVSCLVTAGTGTSMIDTSSFVSGTASAISVGAGTTVQVLNLGRIDSTNTNAVTGAGTINYGLLNFSNTSNTINTTTQTDYITRYGTLQSTIQPAFSAQHTVAQNNVTGNGALPTVNYTTEIFDQGADYDGTNSFTAPYAGRYQFNASIYINDAATSTQGFPFIITSNRNYNGVVTTPFALAALNQYSLIISILADMDAADTCHVAVQVVGMAGDTADIPTTDGQFFSGYLVC